MRHLRLGVVFFSACLLSSISFHREERVPSVEPPVTLVAPLEQPTEVQALTVAVSHHAEIVNAPAPVAAPPVNIKKSTTVSCEAGKAFSGDVFWRTPDDVGDFCLRFNSVEGMVTLEWEASDLQALSCICEVGGLTIRNTVELKSLEGLEALHTVQGSVNISENVALKNVKGLKRLASVGEDLIIDSNPVLASVDGLRSLKAVGANLEIDGPIATLLGFSNLESVGGAFYIDRTRISDLAGLNRLRSVGGSIRIADNNLLESLRGFSMSTAASITVMSNPGLADLTGLERLEKVGYLNVSENGLGRLNGLDGLTEIEFGLHIYGEHRLQNLVGLPEIGVGEFVMLTHNTRLDSLEGLDQVSNRGSWYFTNIPRLADFEGWHPPEVLSGDLSINDMGGLTGMAGLEGVVAVEGNLTLRRNRSLTTLEGLHGLRRVKWLWVRDNPELATLEGLDSLFTLGRLGLDGNERLVSINALAKVTSLERLDIEDNHSLASLAGLDGLAQVRGPVTIARNRNLTDLSALSAVSSVGGSVKLVGNAQLVALDGLHGLKKVDGNIELRFNPVLCDVTALHALHSVGGDLRIVGNVLLSPTQERALSLAVPSTGTALASRSDY